MTQQDRELIREHLETLPSAIASKERELISKNKDILALELINKQIELKTKIAINKEMTPENKKAYPNKDMRDQEFDTRIEANTNYQINRQNTEKTKEEIEDLKIVISQLKRQFTAASVIPMLGV